MTSYFIPPHALEIGEVPADLRGDEAHILQLAAVANRALADSIGYPGHQNFAPPQVAVLLGRLLNNVGDPRPYPDSRFEGRDTLGHEWEVIRFVAGLAGAADPDAVVGYVASGGTEANRWGLLQARRRLCGRAVRASRPGAAIYASQEAHASIAQIAEELELPLHPIPAGPGGGMDPGLLAAACRRRPPGQKVILAATDGTTMRGGTDDLVALRSALLDDALVAVEDLWVHLDAALNAFVTPFTQRGRRQPGLGGGVSSYTASGHKMIGLPFPAAVAVAAADAVPVQAAAEYLGGTNTTLATSRSGLAAITLWLTLRGLGRAGLRTRAHRCLRAAVDAERRLDRLGLRPWRASESIIVAFDIPHAPADAPTSEAIGGRHALDQGDFTAGPGADPSSVVRRWNLATERDLTHIVMVPSAIDRLDDFIDDVATTLARRHTAPCT